jgi:DNA segregation ATPase FtsK/SpoIIIE-like protein
MLDPEVEQRLSDIANEEAQLITALKALRAEKKALEAQKNEVSGGFGNRVKSGATINGNEGVHKPLQCTCYICGEEFGTNSLQIHEKSCRKKYNTDMQKLHEEDRKELLPGPDLSQFPLPRFRSKPPAFECYNEEALRIHKLLQFECICGRKYPSKSVSQYIKCRRRCDKLGVEKLQAEREKQAAEEAERIRREAEEEEAEKRLAEEEKQRQIDDAANEMTAQARAEMEDEMAKLRETAAHEIEEAKRNAEEAAEAARRQAEEDAEVVKRQAREEAEEAKRRASMAAAEAKRQAEEAVAAATANAKEEADSQAQEEKKRKEQDMVDAKKQYEDELAAIRKQMQTELDAAKAQAEKEVSSCRVWCGLCEPGIHSFIPAISISLVASSEGRDAGGGSRRSKDCSSRGRGCSAGSGAGGGPAEA